MKRSQIGSRSLLLVLALTTALASSAAAEDTNQGSINKAHRFLRTEKRGKEILGFLHFGADYLNHQYIGTVDLNNGSFALVYEFKWRTTEDGFTDVAFLCDADGNVHNVKVTKTDAIVNLPFLWANASIKVLGEFLIEQYRDKLSDDDRRHLEQIVNDADAHELLEWSLRLEQFLGS